MLVLKDVNDEGGGGWDLREVLRTEMRWQTWYTVTRWMRGLRALDRDLSWSEVHPKPTPEEMRYAVRTLCVMNLKKEPGASSSNRTEVQRFAREDAAYLREQFELYAPDLVICGGVGPLFASVMESGVWKQTRRGVQYVEIQSGCHMISYYHPQARYPMDMLYYTLVDAVREIRGYS